MRRILRFLVLSGVGTVLDVSLVLLLTHETTVPLVLAVASGWFASAAVGFVLNHLFVFADGRNTVTTAGVRYGLLVVLNFAVGVLGVTFVVSKGVPYFPTRITSSVLLVIFNYVVSHSWVFAVDAATGAEIPHEVAGLVAHDHPRPGVDTGGAGD